MKTYLTYQSALLTIGFLLVSGFFVSSAFAAADAPVKVVIESKLGSYKPGNTLKISWTPASTPIQNIRLIPFKKNTDLSYYLHSALVNDDPVITSGSFTYTLSDFAVPSGSYYVGIELPGATTTVAKSKKAIRIKSRPSLYFGTATGEVNSVAIAAGENVTLKWDAESVTSCKSSSYPKNAKWSKTVSAAGTKKIRVTTPTTFYLTCKNSLGEITTALEVDTEAPVRSPAKLIPSTTFYNTNYRFGTTQSEALNNNASITLFNSSAVEPIYYRIVTTNQPKWVNTGYTTAQLSLPPEGTAGLGAFMDPSLVSRPGTYTWDLRIEGNFSNSPLIIPLTMTVAP